jgi:anti-anti-sigma factor
MSELSEKLRVTTCRGSYGTVLVGLAGALDAAGAGGLIDEVTQIEPGAGDRVVLQLRDVTFLDSAGIGALCYAEAFVNARGGAFTIATPRPHIRTLLKLAGLGHCCPPDDDGPRVPVGSRTHLDRPYAHPVPR